MASARVGDVVYAKAARPLFAWNGTQQNVRMGEHCGNGCAKSGRFFFLICPCQGLRLNGATRRGMQTKQIKTNQWNHLRTLYCKGQTFLPRLKRTKKLTSAAKSWAPFASLTS